VYRWLKSKFPIKKQNKRSYSAGVINRLTSDWLGSRKSADEEIRPTLKRMVSRSRDLTHRNHYARKFIKMVSNNVVGPAGIKLQMRVMEGDREDRQANQVIEKAFKIWGQKYASVEGQHSWHDIMRMFIEGVARDGEIIVRKVKGFDNPFGFALQMIEPDHLDEELNKKLSNGNQIRMGIEFDQWRRPVAYYLLNDHPGDNTYAFSGKAYTRVPADEIIHGFISERPGQSRGVPWMHAAMERLNMLSGLEEAVTVAARVGASQMGILHSASGEEYQGDEVGDDGKVIAEAEPGVFLQLPKGVEFSQFDPKQPSANLEAFARHLMHGVASGLLVSYPSLGSDLSDVNFSSIRQGVLEERDCWRMMQQWMIDHFCEKIIEDWLLMALTTQSVKLPLDKFDKFNAATWQPRGWQWVDPVKDVKASILSIEAGLKTRSQVVAEQGGDLRDIFEKLSEEKKLAKDLGLNFSAEDPQEEGIDEPNNKNRQTLSVV